MIITNDQRKINNQSLIITSHLIIHKITSSPSQFMKLRMTCFLESVPTYGSYFFNDNIFFVITNLEDYVSVFFTEVHLSKLCLTLRISFYTRCLKKIEDKVKKTKYKGKAKSSMYTTVILKSIFCNTHQHEFWT